jgi:hypothetical protein
MLRFIDDRNQQYCEQKMPSKKFGKTISKIITLLPRKNG